MSAVGNPNISGRYDVGTTANDVVALDSSGKLPAVDGSQLTNISGGGGSGTVTSVATGTGLIGGTITTSGTLSVDVGTGNNQIVQLDGSAKLPAVDGSQLTGVVLPSPYLQNITLNVSDPVDGQTSFIRTADKSSGRSNDLKIRPGSSDGGGNLILEGPFAWNANVPITSNVIIRPGSGFGGGGGPAGNVILSATPLDDTGDPIGFIGKIKFSGGVGEGTAGYVWTSTDTAGSGNWVALPVTGASTSLNNLITTDINNDFIFNTGAAAKIKTKDAASATKDLILSSGDATTSSGTTIFSNFPSTGTADYNLSAAGNVALGAPFVAAATIDASTVSFAVANQSLTLSGNLTAELWDDSGGLPGTLLGTSDSIAASTFNAGVNQIDFNFSTPVALTSGTTYHAVFRGDATYLALGTSMFLSHNVANTTPTDFEHADLVWGSAGGAPTPSIIVSSAGVASDSGNVVLTPGDATGNRGYVAIKDSTLGAGAGAVFTLLNSTTGQGGWAAGGGGNSLSSKWTSSDSFTSQLEGFAIPAVYGNDLTASAYAISVTDNVGASGTAPDIHIKAGSIGNNSNSSNGGALVLSGGKARSSGNGGAVSISGGTANGSGNGGDVSLTAGTGSAAGAIKLNGTVVINDSTLSAGAGALFTLQDATTGQGGWNPAAFADDQLANLSQGNVAVNADITPSTDVPLYLNRGNSGDLAVLDGTINVELAHTFTVPVGTNPIGSVTINIKNIAATLLGNLTVDIFSDTAGAPDTSIGTSDAVAANSLNAGADSVSFTFSTPVAVSPATSYWIVLSGDATYNAGTDHITVERPTTDDVPAQTYNGSAWSALGHSMASRVGGSLTPDLGENGSAWHATWSTVVNLTPTAADPASPVEGQVYYNSTAKKLKFYDGSTWRTVTST